MRRKLKYQTRHDKRVREPLCYAQLVITGVFVCVLQENISEPGDMSEQENISKHEHMSKNT